MNLIYIILILLIPQNGQTKNVEQDLSFLQFLKQNGCVSRIKYDNIQHYIDQDAINNIGKFNHYAELLDVGFRPNAAYPFGNDYDRYWLSFIIYQMNEISDHRSLLQLPKFDIDKPLEYRPSQYDLPEDFTLLINNKLVEVNLETNLWFNGLERVQIMINTINKELKDQESQYRFVIFKSIDHLVNTDLNYKTIKNYRISFLPLNLIRNLIKNNDLKLYNHDFSFEADNNPLNSSILPWGKRLPYLDELLNQNQIMYFDGEYNYLLSGPEKLKKILTQPNIKFDKLKLRYFESENFNKILHEFKFSDLDKIKMNSKFIELEIEYKSKKYNYRFKKFGLDNLLWEKEFYSFLNTFLSQTHQNKIITQFHYHSETLAQNVSLYNWLANQKNLYPEGKNIPHLSQGIELMLDMMPVIFIEYNCSKKLLFNMGYIRMEENEFKQYCH